MSDDPVRTIVATPEGEISFQNYFVRHRCEPAVKSLRFEGAEAARISAGVMHSLQDETLRAILIAPSNPYLSIDPILAIPGMTAALRAPGVPVIAVTPIIGDAAVKGPTAKIMKELGIESTPFAVAEHYRGLIDGFVIDIRDGHRAKTFDLPMKTCNTLMHTLEDRERLARDVLDFADDLRRRGMGRG
jgi:LPPG:FO 2-phospho-L-lactate transferase